MSDTSTETQEVVRTHKSPAKRAVVKKRVVTARKPQRATKKKAAVAAKRKGLFDAFNDGLSYTANLAGSLPAAISGWTVARYESIFVRTVKYHRHLGYGRLTLSEIAECQRLYKSGRLDELAQYYGNAGIVTQIGVATVIAVFGVGIMILIGGSWLVIKTVDIVNWILSAVAASIVEGWRTIKDALVSVRDWFGSFGANWTEKKQGQGTIMAPAAA